MNIQIESEVKKIQQGVEKYYDTQITTDKAFNYVVIDNLFYDGKGEVTDLHDSVTDGSNDGGIDFIYIDDENASIAVGQCKYVNSIDNNTIAAEVAKMESSVRAFKEHKSASLNKNVRKALQEALDALPDDADGCVEYYFVSACKYDTGSALKKVTKTIPGTDAGDLNLLDEEDIVGFITRNQSVTDTVPEDAVKIDDTHNMLEYKAANGRRGMFVNVSSHSIVDLYNKLLIKDF